MYVNYRGFYKPNANMKKIHALFSIFLFSICSFGQMDNDGLHEKFLQLLKKEKIDSIYYSYLKVNEGDQKYEEALLYRNQYGWALHELEQLKKDFPAIIKLSRYSNEMEYEKTLHLQRFPPSEWNNLLELATELEKHFESKPIEHREILGVKTMLEFITKNDSALILDASKLLKLMSKNSEAYSMMLWNYGNVLIRTDNNKQAINVFEKGLNQTTNIRFLHSLVRLYYFNKEYEKIISFENQINNDSSGILFFNLAEAYLKQNNIEKAEKYFKHFTEKFKRIDYEPFVQIEYNNTFYQVWPSQLEIIGDFYLKKAKNMSCEYYLLATKIINNPSEDKFFKKQLLAVKDEKQKSKLMSKIEKNKEEEKKLIERLEKKLNQCK